MLTFILLYFNLYLHPRVFLFTRLNPVGMSLSKTLIPDCSTCVHALEKRVWQANVYLLLLYIYLNHIYRILMKHGFQLHLLTITESTPITRRRSSNIKRSRNIRGFVTLSVYGERCSSASWRANLWVHAVFWMKRTHGRRNESIKCVLYTTTDQTYEWLVILQNTVHICDLEPSRYCTNK